MHTFAFKRFPFVDILLIEVTRVDDDGLVTGKYQRLDHILFQHGDHAFGSLEVCFAMERQPDRVAVDDRTPLIDGPG